MNFTQKVYYYTKKIPRGKISTYSEIAKAIGTKAYRAVGTALSKNEHPIVIPCHRVVKSNGEIGGFCGSKKLISKKKKLLESEGIIFYRKNESYYVKDFNKKKYCFTKNKKPK